MAERNKEAGWYYNSEIIHIYEEDSHCYFILFHYDEVGISESEIEEYVKAHGFESIKAAQDEYFDPWTINEFDEFWLGIRDIAYNHGLIRVGFYFDGYSKEFYATCKDIKKQKTKLLDLLMCDPVFKKGNYFTIENRNSELSSRHKCEKVDVQCITAHTLDEAILAVDSY